MRAVLLIPLMLSTAQEVLDAMDDKALEAALDDYKTVNSSTDDEALEAMAKHLDDAFDWAEALDGLGFDGVIGHVLEAIDDDVWLLALKLRRRRLTNKAKRKDRRSPAKLQRELLERMGARPVARA